jgi:hypothetical protein
MARSLAAAIPDIDIPGQLIDDVERDRGAGVDAACEQIMAIRDSGAFDGAHLVPVSRYREVAARLERDLRPSRQRGPAPAPGGPARSAG